MPASANHGEFSPPSTVVAASMTSREIKWFRDSKRALAKAPIQHVIRGRPEFVGPITCFSPRIQGEHELLQQRTADIEFVFVAALNPSVAVYSTKTDELNHLAAAQPRMTGAGCER
jgi:hypothetical protein